MSSAKSTLKILRKQFNDDCLKRDRYLCRVYSFPSKLDSPLEVHHIVNRNDFPNGGYTKYNGISLCPACHLAAEGAAKGDRFNVKYGLNALFELIESNYQKAYESSKALHEPFIFSHKNDDD